MAHNVFIFLLTTLAAATLAAGAAAQPLHCAERGDVVRLLSEIFQERQRGYGLVGDRALVELFLSPTGTWTILSTGRRGRTCIVAAGHAWQEVPTALSREVRTPAVE